MKTFFKIAAVAAIMALAVISCSPPDVLDPHFEYWDQINETYDASQNTLSAYTGSFGFTARSISAAGASVTGLSVNTATGTAENFVEITIGDQYADIFKADNAEAKLKEFLSFYTYNPNEIAPEELGRGKAHTLTAYTGWALERKKNGDTFVLKLTAPLTASSSHLVWKIDSTAYTYRDGLKMDKDGNGIPAEPFYDDFFGSLTVNGLTNSTAPQLPGNRGISVNLSNASTIFTNLTVVGATSSTNDVPAGFNFPTASDTTVKEGANIQILLASSITTAFLSAEDRDDILISLLPGIKIEEFTEANGEWTPSKFFASFDETSVHRIIIKDFKPAHMTAYRLVFEKSGVSLETDKEFFGVKQRITVNFGGTIDGKKTSITRLEGYPRLYFNPLIRNFKSFNEGPYIDNTGTNTTWYTYFYKWAPGYIKNKVETHPLVANPDYDGIGGYDVNGQPATIPDNNPTIDNPDYDADKEADWVTWNGITPPYTPGKTEPEVNVDYNARKAVAATITIGSYSSMMTALSGDGTYSGFDLDKEWALVNYDSGYSEDPYTGDLDYNSGNEALWNSIKDYTPGQTPTISNPNYGQTSPNPAYDGIGGYDVNGQPATIPGPAVYTDLATYYPSTIPDSLNIVPGPRTTSATAPTAPRDPLMPDYNDWVWAGLTTSPWDVGPQVPTLQSSLTKVETVYGDETRDQRVKLEMSSDRSGQNVVLRLEIGPNSITKDGVNTRYYAKQLDLETFKKNFKIVYSSSGNSDVSAILTTPADVVDLNIANVEYKQEKTGSDKFDTSDPKVKYSGYNVIYVTLDPNYKYVSTNNRTKYLLVGSGFAYEDGINVFGSQRIWENKGVSIYSFSNF